MDSNVLFLAMLFLVILAMISLLIVAKNTGK